jgi:hypothetical protein
MEKIEYRGWPNCYLLKNGVLELVLTADVGPRIIRFGFVGMDNEFKEYPETVGQVGGDEWHSYGGHRLWHAPEAQPRSYCPDNSSVIVEPCNDSLRVIQSPEAATGIQKEMEICVHPQRASVRITHRLRNTGLWPVELAPWALTVMAQGGKAILPLPPRGEHPTALLPTSLLGLWAYTDMKDQRWTWGTKYVMLRQDPQATTPQKVGAMAPDGWGAYARAGHLFVKQALCGPDARYPDFGCNVEVFTNAEMLELETLGPITLVQPGSSVEHVERWFLFDEVPVPDNDRDVDQFMLWVTKELRRSE